MIEKITCPLDSLDIVLSPPTLNESSPTNRDRTICSARQKKETRIDQR